MTGRERRKLDAPAEKERVAGNEECVGPVSQEGGEGRFDLAAGAGVEGVSLQSENAGRFRCVSQRGLGNLNIRGIDKHGNANRLGYQFVQQTKALGYDLLA